MLLSSSASFNKILSLLLPFQMCCANRVIKGEMRFMNKEISVVLIVGAVDFTLYICWTAYKLPVYFKDILWQKLYITLSYSC